MQLIDLTSKRFHKLVVIARAGIGTKGMATWKCLCDCGNYTVVRNDALRRTHNPTKSCGCSKYDHVRTHGKSNKVPEYKIWTSMRGRINNKNNTRYAAYGGRGIKLDPRWNSFETFLVDMGPRPSSKHSIDRINNNGDYTPTNCRWATNAEQCNNTRRNKWITWNGQTLTEAEWARTLNIRRTTIQQRLRKNWPLDRVFAPVTS